MVADIARRPRLPLGRQSAFLPNMSDSSRRPSPDAQAEQRIREILRAADSWSREAPRSLMPPIRAVCIRLAEMVADQRHYLAPLPEPQETERRTVLSLVAERLRSKPVVEGVEHHLKELEELELRRTTPTGRAARSLLGRRRGGRSYRVGPGSHRCRRAARPHRGALFRTDQADLTGRGVGLSASDRASISKN